MSIDRREVLSRIYSIWHAYYFRKTLANDAEALGGAAVVTPERVMLALKNVALIASASESEKKSK